MEYIRIAISPFAAALGTCVLHGLLNRIFRRVRVAPHFIALGSIAIVNAALVSSALVFPVVTRPWGLIYVWLVYNCMAFCYLLVLNVSETSLHVHILMEILVAGQMAEVQLSERYNAKHMIDVRIDRMIALGQLTENGDRYVLRSRGLVVAGNILNGWRRMLRLPVSPQGSR